VFSVFYPNFFAPLKGRSLPYRPTNCDNLTPPVARFDPDQYY
jgi:hypothetical protein